MDDRAHARLRARARILKAMAHPTRLFIVEQLAEGPRCVCELQRGVGADISTVSKHLTVLKAAGLVSDERRGNQIFYALQAPCVLRFLGCIEQAARQQARAQLALVS
jgi:ArsR family transcriptional regulator